MQSVAGRRRVGKRLAAEGQSSPTGGGGPRQRWKGANNNARDSAQPLPRLSRHSPLPSRCASHLPRGGVLFGLAKSSGVKHGSNFVIRGHW
jgi:hypothetical protein